MGLHTYENNNKWKSLIIGYNVVSNRLGKHFSQNWEV